MTHNIRSAKRVLASDIPVLLCGEPGTGKAVFARAFHNSGGVHRPFVAVNCAAQPESVFESELFAYEGGELTEANRARHPGKILQANGGTFFLDNISDMSLPLQACLLRVLKEREVGRLGGESTVTVDFRLICATHRDLVKLIAKGEFP